MVIFVDFIRNHSSMFNYNGMSLKDEQVNATEIQSGNSLVDDFFYAKKDSIYLLTNKNSIEFCILEEM